MKKILRVEHVMWIKNIFWIYELTISLFFESIASIQKHPKILQEVCPQDQVPYKEKESSNLRYEFHLFFFFIFYFFEVPFSNLAGQ